MHACVCVCVCVFGDEKGELTASRRAVNICARRAPEDNPFVVDIVRDIRLLNDQALKAKKSGMVILGGG